ncbi:MAG: hypothetical protein ACHQNA_02125, partial [Acidimicrobiales bacterium]
ISRYEERVLLRDGVGVARSQGEAGSSGITRPEGGLEGRSQRLSCPSKPLSSADSRAPDVPFCGP